jgi:hypothetical protein
MTDKENRRDMAICLVIFNPTQSKRIIMNYLYVENLFKIQNLPVFSLELVYNDREPELPNAFHVHGSSFMFHKENLYEILESKIPEHYTKLAFLDADVYFSDINWYSKTSELLNTFDIVQPFEQAHWLDLTYKKTIRMRRSIVCNEKPGWDFAYHPGFAWCMRREFYKKVGFFKFAIIGGGDLLSASIWFNKKFPLGYQGISSILQKKYQEFEKVSPNLTFLQGSILYHLFHGAIENRQYGQRHLMLNVEGEFEEYVEVNEEGVFEWKDKEKWNPLILTYFKNRNDDGYDNNLSKLHLMKNPFTNQPALNTLINKPANLEV